MNNSKFPISIGISSPYIDLFKQRHYRPVKYVFSPIKDISLIVG
jgi:hypothetical protein